MWPNDNFGRGGNYNPKPDCRDNGPHRWGNLRFLPADKRVTIRVCRFCEVEKIRRMEIIDGKFVETPIISSTPSNHSDKSTTDNDVKKE
jgi:hypothetical protein